MNRRSFRSSLESSQMRQRQQLTMTTKEKEEDEEEEQLALFLDMKKREMEQQQRDNNHDNHLFYLINDHSLEAYLKSDDNGSKPLVSNVSSATARKTSGADDFLSSENDKNDDDWLVTFPGTPLFPSLEVESRKTIMSHIGTSKVGCTALKSRLANPQPEPATRGTIVTKQSTSSPGLNSTSRGVRRPPSPGGPGSRPATPTGCSSSTPALKPSRSSTPTSRTTLPSSRSSVTATKPNVSAPKPTPSAKVPTVPARSSTPTRSAARPSTPTRAAVRSSTPTRSAPRSSTPTVGSSIPPSKSMSRASTPTQRSSTSVSAPSLSAPIKSSPSVTRTALTTARNSVPACGISPSVKSRPWKPSELPGFSLDTPPNLRTTLPERPLSASRGRPGAPSSRSFSVEPTPNGRPRRQSCSPARGRAPNGIVHPSGSSVPAISRLHAKANDNVSPVLMGTKMVERVINMRKLAPPKQDKLSPHGNRPGKSSSPDSSGFGRTLSKKSLDMAIRHMDIRRTIPGNLRPLMTNIPASSMYSVRSGSTRSRTISVSDSPLATSSNASSEVSVNNNGLYLDGIELEEGIGIDRGEQSPS